MAITQFPLSDGVNEGSTAEYACDLVDASGDSIDASAVLTIVATLRANGVSAVINGRDDQNVKDINGGTLTDGAFTLELSALDNVIVSSTSDREELHKLTLQMTYNKTGGGTGALTHEVRFYVLNLTDVG
jgi:hypothetical protein